MTFKMIIRALFSFIIAFGFVLSSAISANVVGFLHDQVAIGLSSDDYVTIYFLTTILFLMSFSFAVLRWYEHILDKADYS